MSLGCVRSGLARVDYIAGLRRQLVPAEVVVTSQVRPAPWVGLLGSLWLVLSNFTLVTGGSATLSTVLAAIPFVGLISGAAAGVKDDAERTEGVAVWAVVDVHPATV
jgi:hypothetical protein